MWHIYLARPIPISACPIPMGRFPPPQVIEIFNSAFTPQNCKLYSKIQACGLTVLLNKWQCLYCLMKQNIVRIILPLDEHDWLKWLHNNFRTHDLLVDRDVCNESVRDA